ncbi:hypothetical protein FVEG_09582 [Fusarium verticillioides 7600]|uniref:Uncharacterized protein n=1 Tax=Gibberella moniliformis (strain M3125 / FGSC 7600) TaxID=334819 RepID=W7MRR2_GIBM7|nr:hypothetical protein FVEG_09582 [Fusarium verticillioides 7600]EWG50335.1 hypothetical protein FVEG_09582 [Fusarium verticillioides 7600]RBQ80688.1 hypothetical protein FVER14953_09582 [Fusarium verticillioides]RBQ99615.1 hypothetical protein FVER53263_09582 [Fusarium verticillioides]
MKLLLWLTAAHVAQAAGRHGIMKKRQAEVEGVAHALKFEGLRLSYITETETATQKVTETETATVVQTVQGEAEAAAGEVVTVTINAPPVTVTETKTEVVNEVQTQFVTQVQVMTQYVTQIAAAPPPVVETVTQAQLVTVIVPGEAPAPVTVIHTVQAPAESDDALGKFNPGVTTIPIPESLLPKTTLASDPFAVVGPIRSETIVPQQPSSIVNPVENPAPTAVAPQEPSSVEQPATTQVAPVEPSSIKQPATTQPVVSEQPTTTSAAQGATTESTASQQPASSIEEPMVKASSTQGGQQTYAPSMELGNMGPDTTGRLAQPALDGTKPTTTANAESASRTRVPIDLSDPSKLSSVLNLGNLVGGNGALKARATGKP